MSTGAPGRSDEVLVAFLRVAVALVVATAGAGLALPGAAGRAAAWAMVTILIGAPFLRVAWLACGWARNPDWRFFGAAVSLLGLTAVAALLAALT